MNFGELPSNVRGTETSKIFFEAIAKKKKRRSLERRCL